MHSEDGPIPSYAEVRMPMPDRGPHFPPCSSRRAFLEQAGGGLGMIALAWLGRQDEARAASARIAGSIPRLPTRAKRLIYLFMHGGPSHLETFDPKPDLQRLAGKPLP